MTKRAVFLCDGPQGLFDSAAAVFGELAEEAVRRTGRFTVALSGGSTPRGLYARLAEEPYVSQMPWRSVHFFWGDERCVPPDHPESNYRMVHDALLSRVPVPDSCIHRPRAEDNDPAAAAESYEREISEFF